MPSGDVADRVAPSGDAQVLATAADDAYVYRAPYYFPAGELNRDALRMLDRRAGIYGGVRVGEPTPVEGAAGQGPMVCVEYDFLTEHDADDFMPGVGAQ